MKQHFITLGLIINFACVTATSATSVLPVNLQQLSTRATLIFYGEVINNQTKRDNNSGTIVTFTTFKIIDLIKGKTETLHTIKQIGGFLNQENLVHRIPGIPKFHTGKQYFVFLPKKSKQGFSSPLGLQQGSYSVTTTDDIKTINNGRVLTQQPALNISSTTLPLAVNANKASQARLEDFINTVRSHMAK